MLVANITYSKPSHVFEEVTISKFIHRIPVEAIWRIVAEVIIY